MPLGLRPLSLAHGWRCAACARGMESCHGTAAIPGSASATFITAMRGVLRHISHRLSNRARRHGRAVWQWPSTRCATAMDVICAGTARRIREGWMSKLKVSLSVLDAVATATKTFLSKWVDTTELTPFDDQALGEAIVEALGD